MAVTRRAESWARRPSRRPRTGTSSCAAGRPLPERTLGARGLSAPVAAPGGRPAARRASGRAGPAQADGRGSPVRSATRGKSDDRRPGGRPGGAAPTRSAGGPLDGAERELRLLVDHREDLVAERTRPERGCAGTCIELSRAEPRGAGSTGGGPGRPRGAPRRPSEPAGRDRPRPPRAGARSDACGSTPSSARSRRCHAAPPTLLALRGCGPLTAAKIVGETAGIGRFRSREAFARHNGTAPVPVWSGNVDRFRLKRGGNRQLNVALHRIAITQMRMSGSRRGLPEHRSSRRRHQDRGHPGAPRGSSDEVYRRTRPTNARRTHLTCHYQPLDIGASGDRLPAPLSRPADFFGFWSQTLEELARVAPAAGLEVAGRRAGILLQRLSFASLGGVVIHGYLLRWEDKQPDHSLSTATATAGRSRRSGRGRGPASTWSG